MKKTLSNFEVEVFVKTMTDNDGFLARTRLPHSVRQACRINLKTLKERLEIYNEGRNELLIGFVKDGKATADDVGNVKFNKEYINEISKELLELANVANDIEFEAIDETALNAYLENNDLSLTEEDILLFFSAK